MAVSADEYDEDYDDYYDEDEEGVSGFVVLVVAVVVLVVFSAVVWFAYQRGLQDSGTPVLTAPAEPIKTEQPVEFAENPGQREVNQTLEGTAPTQVIVDASPDRDPLEGFTETASASETVSTELPALSEPEPEIETIIAQSEPEVSEPEPAIPPVAEPVREEPAPQPQSELTVSVTAPSAAAGTHVVQVGAFRSNQEALTYFERLERNFGALLSGKAPDVQRADLGERGIYFRLRVGPFDSRDAATTYCNQLKAGGQDCLVRPV